MDEDSRRAKDIKQIQRTSKLDNKRTQGDVTTLAGRHGEDPRPTKGDQTWMMDLIDYTSRNTE